MFFFSVHFSDRCAEVAVDAGPIECGMWVCITLNYTALFVNIFFFVAFYSVLGGIIIIQGLCHNFTPISFNNGVYGWALLLLLRVFSNHSTYLYVHVSDSRRHRRCRHCDDSHTL